MKTTIDVDEVKLQGVMRLGNLRSRKAAVNYALACAERHLRVQKVMECPLPDDAYAGALDPAYDLERMRNADTP